MTCFVLRTKLRAYDRTCGCKCHGEVVPTAEASLKQEHYTGTLRYTSPPIFTSIFLDEGRISVLVYDVRILRMVVDLSVFFKPGIHAHEVISTNPSKGPFLNTNTFEVDLEGSLI
jgi:hypothetical protein